MAVTITNSADPDELPHCGSSSGSALFADAPFITLGIHGLTLFILNPYAIRKPRLWSRNGLHKKFVCLDA